MVLHLQRYPRLVADVRGCRAATFCVAAVGYGGVLDATSPARFSANRMGVR
jgi:hypothetical protein